MARSHSALLRAANTTLLVDGDLAAVDEFFTRTYVAHGTGKDLTGGHAAVRRLLGPLRRAFADLDVELEILVAGQGRVAWQRTLRGTHRGAYKGFPATGRRMTWRDMVTSRIVDGRIAEDWVITDLAEHLLRARRRPR